MTYELVKYAYGKTKRYTAFCLTPKLRTPRTQAIGGKMVTFTNQGANSTQAKHFQTPLSALSWLESNGHKLFNPDFSLLHGTGINGAMARQC